MEIVKKKIVFDGHYQLNLVDLKNSKGKTFQREQFKTPNSVAVLVHQKAKKKIVLVKQFRLGPEKELLEIVAGKIESSDIEVGKTAEREILEETGYATEEIRKIHEFYLTPGPITEHMTLFYASVSEKVEKGGGLEVENEEIEIIELSEEEFKNKEFNDAKSLIAQKWFSMNF